MEGSRAVPSWPWERDHNEKATRRGGGETGRVEHEPSPLGLRREDTWGKKRASAQGERPSSQL